MDPFSHAALGRTLVEFVPGAHRHRGLAVAGTLGALSPDIDAVVMPFGWDLYLRIHEIGTHSVVGTLTCALLTGSVVRLFAPSHPMRRLVRIAWAGAISHVALDLVSSARLRVFWPLADQQVSIPLVAMADPWLAGILVVGALATVFTGRGRTAVARTSPASEAPEPGENNGRAKANGAKPPRKKTPRVAGLAVGIGAAFLVIKAMLAVRAIESYQRATQVEAPRASPVIEARWATLSQWHVFDRTSAHLRFWRANGITRGTELILTWPLTDLGSRVAASRDLPTVRNFLRVHDLVFAATVAQPGGRDWVLWSDIRYCWSPDRERRSILEPVVRDGGASLSCALWFGGEFDRNGDAIHQIVRVAGFTQTRPLAD